MDPDEALAELRQLVLEANVALQSGQPLGLLMERGLETFTALDAHLSHGGDLPTDWLFHEGIPRG
jgi:hypothetical protein